MEKVLDTIKIEKLEGGAFNVVQGNKYSETLSYDEMLGLVSALTIPKEPNCLRWMQTKEEHEIRFNSFKKSAEDISEVEFEDILVPEGIEIYRYNGYSQDDDGDGLLIGFNNNNQLLAFCNGYYSVVPYSEENYDKIQCKLISCKREDFKAGDTAFADLSNDFEHSSSYCKIIDEVMVVYITPSPNSTRVMAWSEPSLQWYKVVPV